MNKGTKLAGAKTFRLADDFPPHTYEEWRRESEKLLKGKSFDETLRTPTYEGITLEPIYFPPENQAENDPLRAAVLNRNGNTNDWEIAQEISAATPQEFNAALKHDLERGQTAVYLRLEDLSATLDSAPDDKDEAGQGGITISALEDLETALSGVNLEKFPLYIRCQKSALRIAGLLAALCEKRGFSLKKLRGCLGGDCLSKWAESDNLPQSPGDFFEEIAQLTARAKTQTPNLQTIWIEADRFHNAGSSAVQELAFAIAAGAQYLREMLSRNLSLEDVAPRIRFSFGLGENFFIEIAKLRAARWLWSQVVEAFGGDETAQKMFIHASTSRRNKTLGDPYLNMLRATTEALSGAIGGCDSLQVEAFDEPGTPGEFFRRFARNTQIILKEESFFHRVIDPAGGSWYVESLTGQIAEKSWKLFQQVEEKGGMLAALRQKFPQKLLAETARQRKENLEKGVDKRVGFNIYQKHILCTG